MSKKTILNGLSWTLVGELVNKATLFFATMYFAKKFSAEGYGLFSLLQAVAMYSVMLIEISPTMYGIREIAKLDDEADINQKAQEIYSLRVFSGLFVAVTYVVIVFSLNLNETTKTTALAFSLYIIAYALFTDWLHKGRENFKGIAIASLSQALVFIPLMFLFVEKESDIYNAALIWSASFLVFASSLIIQQKKELGSYVIPLPDISKWIKNIAESYHFVLNGVLGMAYQFIPLFMLSYLSTLEQVGSFSLIYKMVFAVCGVAFYLPSVFYPKLASSYNKNNKQFTNMQAKLLLLMVMGGIIFLVAATLAKSLVIDFFDANKYVEIEKLYNILVFLVVAYLIRFSFNIPLFAMGRQNIITRQMLVATMVVVVAGLPLIIYLKAIGAAYTVMLGECSIIIIAISAYFKNKPRIEPDV